MATPVLVGADTVEEDVGVVVVERVPTGVEKFTTVPFATKLPSVFLTVAVIVVVPTAVAVTLMFCGFARTVTCDSKVTFTVLLTFPAEAVTMTSPAVELVRVEVAVPVPPVVVEEAVESVPVPLVTVKETAVPSATAVPALFFTVAVMVTEAPTTGEDEDAVTATVADELADVTGNQSTPQPAISIVHTAKRQTILFMTPP